MRQGPSYPPANDFTGQRAVDGSSPASASAPEQPPQPPNANQPAPESTYGDPAFTHGRGNQGMRPQK